jgi:CAI-1 autoinducer synthase
MRASEQTASLGKKLRAENCLHETVQCRVDAVIGRMQNWGGQHILHGLKPSRDSLQMSSNDYLSLLNEPELKQRQASVLFKDERELLQSAVFQFGDTPQKHFEKRLAQFMGAEDGVLCQSGWAANTGLLQSLASARFPVYIDMFAHASLWEGARAAGARGIRFMHNNWKHAHSQIVKNGPGVIVIDSVYSTNGSLAPIERFVEVAELTGSIFVVDESHSLGTHGSQGRGLVCAYGLEDRVHFRTASLAKTFAGRAGFVTCSSDFKSYFVSESRPSIFSSALLEHEIAWFDAALDFISIADDRRANLHRMSNFARAQLAELGYNVSEGSEQIIGLEAGEEWRTLALRNALERRGVFGSVFCAPATADSRSLVRLTVNARHDDSDMARLIAVCAEIREEVDLANWSSTKRCVRRQESPCQI